jgi:hypothetical protein
VAAVLMLLGLGVSQGLAQDASEMSMKDYTKHLLDVYGDTGVIIAGTINGKDKDGNFIVDSYPSADADKAMSFSTIKPLSYTMSTTQCPASQVITRINSGAYSFPWCANTKTIGGTTYEAQRDTLYYTNGRWTYIISTFFDCQNSSDLAQMPTVVSVAVCH